MQKTRFDIVLTLVLSVLIGFAASMLAHKLFDKPSSPPTRIEIVAGTVGAPADESIPRVNSVSEMKQHDLFTIAISRDHYHYINETDSYFYLTLPSGETVIAHIFEYSVQLEKDLNDLLPIGSMINEQIPEDVANALDRIRIEVMPDFYLDMKGEHEAFPAQNLLPRKQLTDFVWLITTILSFLLIRLITVKAGFFPPILPKKKITKQ